MQHLRQLALQLMLLGRGIQRELGQLLFERAPLLRSVQPLTFKLLDGRLFRQGIGFVLVELNRGYHAALLQWRDLFRQRGGRVGLRALQRDLLVDLADLGREHAGSAMQVACLRGCLCGQVRK